MYRPNQVILREYDIRGTFNINLFVEDAVWLGKHFGSLVFQKGGRKVVACRDGRASSPILHKHLCEALIACGLQVLDVGIGPTPMSYFAGYHLQADATLMITGSHNPKDDNGIKITLDNKSFFGNQIKDLLEQPVNLNLGGGYINFADEVVKAYAARLTQGVGFKKPLKIAWDAGNGAAGPLVEMLASLLSQHTHELLFTEIDCNFPNHHPDPSVAKNMQHLIDVVKQHNCDIGFAFDGDGDRIGVVDSTGRIIAGDELVTIISAAILKQVPGVTIVADVKCGRNTFKAIEDAGGKAIMGKTGHSWIKQTMRENDAAFAGEMSGHMFFKHNYYGFDDGLYTATFLVDYLQNLDCSFSSIVELLPKLHSTPEIRVECCEERKFAIVNEIKQKLLDASKPFIDIDGVRIDEAKGWWLVRASNTQSVLVVRAEADTAIDLQNILSTIKSLGLNI
ncbi:MAG: phosphomannomutase/phosphoglucomutase [Proteobacteria bacterium]|nr:phosphomannomutase/phosphoglucomutase [Pseudomonadota bacterium]